MITLDRPSASLHPNFRMFDEAGGENRSKKTASLALRLDRKVGNLPADPFDAANATTNRLLENGWRYNSGIYLLSDMLRRRAGNCLGLSCLYGSLLEAHEFEVGYELVIGPKGFQCRDEQGLLDFMLCGHAFPFHSPLFPTRPAKGEKLLFCTLGHPRLVIGGKRFETTALQEQGPSQIRGERIRQLSYRELVGLVYYERAHGARLAHDLSGANQLLNVACGFDPCNDGAYAERAQTAFDMFDEEAFERALKKFKTFSVTDSNYLLERYLMCGDRSDLEKSLQANPTNMRAWPLVHVIYESDAGNQRANLAIAAQCIARSGSLNLGDFYATYASSFARLFPGHAVSLVKQSCDSGTDDFEHHFAMAMLGSCKGVKWTARENPHDYLAKIMRRRDSIPPLQKTRLLFAVKRLSACNGDWEEHKSQYAGRKTFQATVDSLDQQWASL